MSLCWDIVRDDLDGSSHAELAETGNLLLIEALEAYLKPRHSPNAVLSPGAVRQATYRRKKRLIEAQGETVDRGWIHGETSGGFDGSTLEKMVAAGAREHLLGGEEDNPKGDRRRVTAAGYEKDEDEPTVQDQVLAAGGWKSTTQKSETDGTFVRRHLTKAVHDRLVKEKGHLDKREAEQVVHDLIAVDECSECGASDRVEHYWDKHLPLIRDVLRRLAGTKSCPSIFHALLLEHPERLEAKCPCCGKHVKQKGAQESKADLFSQLAASIPPQSKIRRRCATHHLAGSHLKRRAVHPPKPR